MLDIQAGDGEHAVEGDYPDDVFYFDKKGQPCLIPSQPSPNLQFDYTAREWIDPRKLDQIRDEAKAKVIAWASAMLSQFTAGYPHEEVLSWSAKLPAARNVLHGGIEPMIQIEAKALGIDPKELAAKVAEKGGRYEAIVALAAAIRGRTHAEIDAAPDAASVDATVDKALARATETLKSLGVEYEHSRSV